MIDTADVKSACGRRKGFVGQFHMFFISNIYPVLKGIYETESYQSPILRPFHDSLSPLTARHLAIVAHSHLSLQHLSMLNHRHRRSNYTSTTFNEIDHAQAFVAACAAPFGSCTMPLTRSALSFTASLTSSVTLVFLRDWL